MIFWLFWYAVHCSCIAYLRSCSCFCAYCSWMVFIFIENVFLIVFSAHWTIWLQSSIFMFGLNPTPIVEMKCSWMHFLCLLLKRAYIEHDWFWNKKQSLDDSLSGKRIRPNLYIMTICEHGHPHLKEPFPKWMRVV